MTLRPTNSSGWRLTPLLAAVALLVLALVPAPAAQAQAVTTPTEDDLWRQVAVWTAPPGVYDTCTTQMSANAVALTAGHRYFVSVAGTGRTSGSGVAFQRSSGGVGANVFTVYANGTVALGQNVTEARLLYHANYSTSYTPFVATLAVKVNVTTTYNLWPTVGGSCYGIMEIAALRQVSTSHSAATAFPPGILDPSRLMGYVGAWNIVTSGTLLGYSGVVLDAAVARAGEAAVRTGETTKTPSASSFTWSYLNKVTGVNDPRTLFANDVRDHGDALHTHPTLYLDNGEISAYSPQPAYAWKFVFELQVQSSCSGSVTFATATGFTNNAWDVTKELSNITVTLTAASTGSVKVAVDYREGVVTTDNPNRLHVDGPYAYSMGGGSVSITTSPHFPSSTPRYFKAWSSTAACGNAFEVNVRETNLVTNAVPYWDAGSGYTSNSLWDWSKLEVWRSDVPGTALQPGGVWQWRLNATPQVAGGALYLYLRSEQNATAGKAPEPADFVLSTDKAGVGFTRGLHEECGALGGGLTYCIWEYRIGFMGSPEWNATEGWTLTIDATASLKNAVYVGRLVNQPASRPHVQLEEWPRFANASLDLPVYRLFTTDDHYTRAAVTVRECNDAGCTSMGNVVPNVSYVATICTYNARTTAGTANATGQFDLLGQDLAGCDVSLTLTASTYAETPWLIRVPGPGTHTYVVGILKSSAHAGTATLQGPSVTFTGNTTRVVPDRVEVNVTRSRNVALFVGLDRLESTTGLLQHNVVRASYWQAGQSNVFQFYHPARARSTSQDLGLYVLWVMNETGAVLAHQKFFILGAGQTASQYDALITSDMLRSIESAGYVSALQSFQVVHQANILATQKNVRDQMYENFQRVNEYGWFAVGFLLFLATIRAIRR